MCPRRITNLLDIFVPTQREGMETGLERSALAIQKRSLALFVLALAGVLGAATVNLLISIFRNPTRY